MTGQPDGVSGNCDSRFRKLVALMLPSVASGAKLSERNGKLP